MKHLAATVAMLPNVLNSPIGWTQGETSLQTKVDGVKQLSEEHQVRTPLSSSFGHA